ncbi:SpoIIE family protein phosphatase [Actinokineospora globicatena]|uniref:SpoIIE family protein phosphatase n=1 Tax=Actinokineospora globicatena TaxID=103729 RepID=UPI0020A5EFB9|nr:SpoIIE family protein phosphatase [Actinokineospora globicatena]MCP2304483.1 PAS domain S-box-containing protein [Actinokineospora globicatena]GLW78151.1 histidine kinase [Actinokineospora globicatena]GLW85183.1 histidine kinase [Actinokineospora globicatena]
MVERDEANLEPDLRALMAALDWSATGLGPRQAWDPQLSAVVRTMLSSRQQMVLFWGPDKIALYNDAYAPTIGAKHPRALGMPARENWGELWEVLDPLLERVIGTGESFWAEDYPFPIERHGFLEQTYFDISYDPVVVDSGAVGGVLCLVTETTGRVLGERRMRTLGELGTRLAGLTDVRRISEVAAAVLADNPEDLPEVAIRLLGRDDDPALLAVADSGAAAWPDPGTLALPLLSASSTAGVLVVRVNPMLEVGGPYREFLDLLAATISAVLSRAVAQEQERLRARALAELDRAKTELFANISHELRTPLTLIAGPAEDALIDLDDPPGPRQRDRLELIRRNAARLRRMVDNILDFTRIESGALRPEPVGTDLGAFTRAIAMSFHPAVDRAGLDLRLDCPRLARPVYVDREMWQRILLNLLSNAVKFTLAGHIRVTVSELGERVAVTVADTGLGIAEDQVPLLFRRFHRVRGAGGRSQEGTGIGLALVQELVHLHDGEIAVTSTPGVGTAFTITLPHGSGASAPAEGVPVSTVDSYLDEAYGWTDDDQVDTEAGGWALAGRTAGATVLVVEDNADLRGFLARLLGAHWPVTVAANGEQALALIRARRPDLVLSDVTMPGLDGFGLLAALRGNPATEQVPVILLSARAGEEAAVEGLSAGADDYVVKPFSSLELIARVRSTLELARLRTHQTAWRAALVDALEDGFFTVDADGTMLEMNAACGTILGYGAEGLPYAPPYPWWPTDPDLAADRDRVLAAALAGGGGRHVLPARRADGRDIWVSMSLNRVPGRADGRQVFVGTLREVTADVRAAERDQVQAGFGAALAEVTGVEQVLDAGVRWLGRAWRGEPAVVVSWPPDLTTTAPDAPEVLAADPPTTWADLPERARIALVAARTTRVPQVVTDQSGAALGIAGPLDTSAPPTAAWVPFAHPTVLPEVDRYLFSALCGQFGVALSRARSYESLRTVSETLQRSILGPTNLPEGFAVRYEPAVSPLEVGGDWYDVLTLDGDRTAVVVGDCVGRGLAAASVMGQLRSACRALLLRAIGPADLLAALDDFAELLPGAFCTTLFCAIIDHGRGELVYSSAGHPPAIVVGPGGDSELLDRGTSVPLAVPSTGPRAEASVALTPGCTLLLYTDGLVERRGETLDEGMARAAEALRVNRELDPAEIADKLLVELLPTGGHDDDVAVLLYRQPLTGRP